MFCPLDVLQIPISTLWKPESNEFRVLEGQEHLMDKIEELAHKAKVEQGATMAN